MAIKIGHASGDERHKATGGAAGDQTGGEVCVRSWYSSPWDVVLRFKDAAKAEKAAKAMEAACANANIGYDQYQRNTLNDKAKAVDYELGKIMEVCECDCSSLVTVCAQAAGVDVPYVWGNAPYTGNMRAQFTSTGEFEVLTDSKYFSSDAYLKRGDILLRTSGHTAIALENGAKSGATGATRPTGAGETAGAVTMKTELPLLKKGSKGQAVWAMQTLLTDRGYNTQGVDGDFGANTEAALKKFQSAMALEVDGECGAKSWQALIAKG